MALSNKVVIVTGGGSGIGEASCRAFAREGAAVVVANRTLAKAEAVARSITEGNGTAVALQVDVCQSADIQRMMGETMDRFGRVDVLFNNAGISPSGRVTEISEDDWDLCLAIDLKSVFLGAKYVIPHMQRQGGGAIINTAGTFGIRAATNKAAYSTAKAGVINLTRSIALDYARDNIRCNAICPGFVETPLTAGMTSAGRDEFLAAYQPLKGVIQADEVATLAVYLASDAARMITGQVFAIDGGQQAGLFA
jgi:NAD(P)-dependent dehydrogenase (short-subunit alcohol dehydrogenase family)